MNSKAVTYRLSENAISYISKYADENHLTNTKAIEEIISFHQNQSTTELDKIADQLLNRFEEKYKNWFTRMRLATNYSEKNIQIVIELLNSLIISSGVDKAYLTDEFKSLTLKEAEELVQKRIADYKQLHDNAKK